VFADAGDIESLDPAWAFDTSSRNIVDNVYEYLFALPGKGTGDADLVPVLAARVPTRRDGLVSKDGLTYRIPVRKGVRFQDGGVMTPEDVRYSLLRFMLTDRAAGPSYKLLDPVLGLSSTRGKDGKLLPGVAAAAFKAVRVEGGAVVIRLKRPYAPFLEELSGAGAVMSRAWCTAHGQWDGREADAARYNDPKAEDTLGTRLMDGTGPFRLERYDPAQKRLVLSRFDGYWRRPARLKEVVVTTVREFSARKLMLEAGDADAIYVPVSYVSQLQGLPGVRVTPGLHTPGFALMLLFSKEVSPAGRAGIGSGRLDGNGVPPDFFSDPDARKAFADSVDYAGFIRDAMGGEGRQPAGFIPQGFSGYDRARKPRYRYAP
ncbi:MAG: ABC transporter substrate-binding protein, partial [Elusimicrobia bacterium]|nr:ABC transporter substrate-binding protein [Elusimicrobiota bacterium]